MEFREDKKQFEELARFADIDLAGYVVLPL